MSDSKKRPRTRASQAYQEVEEKLAALEKAAEEAEDIHSAACDAWTDYANAHTKEILAIAHAKWKAIEEEEKALEKRKDKLMQFLDTNAEVVEWRPTEAYYAHKLWAEGHNKFIGLRNKDPNKEVKEWPGEEDGYAYSDHFKPWCHTKLKDLEAIMDGTNVPEEL